MVCFSTGTNEAAATLRTRLRDKITDIVVTAAVSIGRALSMWLDLAEE